jgi:hypothetical protein
MSVFKDKYLIVSKADLDQISMNLGHCIYSHGLPVRYMRAHCANPCQINPADFTTINIDDKDRY